MPNWVSNTVTMERLCDCNVFDEDGEFDFNKIVPQPRSIEECPVKYVIPELERKNSNIEILKDRPWFNWYEWNWDYWGTKWRVHDTHKKDKNNIRFKTAWCPPLKVIKALSKKYPNRMVKIYFVSEDYDGEHYLLYKNGKVLAIRNIVDKSYWDNLY